MAGSSPEPDPREAGLARLLGLSPPPGRQELLEIIVARATDLGAALADEAASSDDVHDAATAGEYLDLRLQYLAGLIPEGSVATVRRAFTERSAGW